METEAQQRSHSVLMAHSGQMYSHTSPQDIRMLTPLVPSAHPPPALESTGACLPEALPRAPPSVSSLDHADRKGGKARRRQKTGLGDSRRLHCPLHLQAPALGGGLAEGPQACHYSPPLPGVSGGQPVPRGPVCPVNQVCGKNNKSAAPWLELVLQSSLICSPRGSR